MQSRTSLLTAAVTLAAAAAAHANTTYVQTNTGDQVAAGSLAIPDQPPRRIGGVVPGATELYGFIAQPNEPGGDINIGVPGAEFDPLLSGAAQAFAGINSGNGFDIRGAQVVNGNILFAAGGNVGVYNYNIGANAVTQVLTGLEVAAATDANDMTPNNLGDFQTYLPNGDVLFYDSSADSLLTTDGSTGNVSLFADSGALTGAIGNDIVSALLVVGNTLFLGSDSNDTLFTLDLTDADPLDTASAVLDAATLELVTGSTTAGFDGLVVQSDGTVTFYENRSDSIVSFNVSDPAGTAGVVLSSQDLIDGPMGNDLLTSLFVFQDEVYFFDALGNASSPDDGIYQIIPDPASLGLRALGGLVLRRRR
ncbi:MAG: hypothetical protein AAF743_00740 [Planctomycetota bacterium]